VFDSVTTEKKQVEKQMMQSEAKLREVVKQLNAQRSKSLEDNIGSGSNNKPQKEKFFEFIDDDVKDRLREIFNEASEIEKLPDSFSNNDKFVKNAIESLICE